MSVVPDSHDPNSQGSLTPPDAAAQSAPATLDVQSVMADIPRLRAVAYALMVALAAGSLGWYIGEKTLGFYEISATPQGRGDFTALNREIRVVVQKNTAIAYGTFGALLGLLCGAAGGAFRRSIRGGVNAALAGLLLGGIGGALVSYALTPIFIRFFSDEAGALILSFGIRCCIWGVVGLTAGLALGWGWRGLRGITPVLTGGMAGAVCGTIAFEVVNAVLFPAERDDAVIPSSIQARLLAYLFVSVGAAIAAVFAGRHQSTPTRPTVEPRLN